MVLSMDRWAGKIAIVTGASAGIGASIAEALVEHGLIVSTPLLENLHNPHFQVVGTARRSEQIEEHAKQLSGKKGKLCAFKADFTKEEDILKVFEWTSKNLGPIHVLINNAGRSLNSTLVDGKTEEWKSVLDLNILGLCIATREAVRIMRENNINGHIFHINSVMGHKVFNSPNTNVYPASKHAVTALTETLRFEFTNLGLKIKITVSFFIVLFVYLFICCRVLVLVWLRVN